MKNQSVSNNIDWVIVSIYIVMVILGWLNIYSSSLPEIETSLFDLSQYYGKQMLTIVFTIPLIIIVLSVESKFYEKFSFLIYIIGLLSIAGLFIFGKEVKGQTNWYSFGSFGLQPSEFAKAATSLALAKYLSDVQVNLKNLNYQIIALGIIFLPILFIAPHDPGSALIYTVLIFVLHREGLPSSYLWLGLFIIIIFILSLVMNPIYIILITFFILSLIYYRSRIVDRNLVVSAIILLLVASFSYSTSYVFDNVLKQHHRDRFNILLGKKVDDKGIGYNVNQSKIAIGSGGLFGKGYLEGTQTKGGFVPEQHTDYIFTTVGEEWGFIGSLFVIGLYLCLIFRIIYLSERQKTKFSRIYGYCVASILFVHFFVNIAMVLGIFPTIGVPLPFFSYGGSGLWGFTILLFIFLKLDANKVNEW